MACSVKFFQTDTDYFITRDDTVECQREDPWLIDTGYERSAPGQPPRRQFTPLPKSDTESIESIISRYNYKWNGHYYKRTGHFDKEGNLIPQDSVVEEELSQFGREARKYNWQPGDTTVI